MLISDVMTANPQVAKPSDTVTDVARRMTHLDAGSIPIVENGRILGIITDRDIVLRVVGERRSFDTGVDEVMSTDVQTCREDAPITDVLFQMTDKQVRRILIVDAADRLTGIVSLGDVAQEASASKAGAVLEDISEAPANN
ncbi:MAG: CBS domain-containing protein [Caulobacterales bacterium]|nr:CBS domain-containing protein [Caulobacterales bacterium]